MMTELFGIMSWASLQALDRRRGILGHSLRLSQA